MTAADLVFVLLTLAFAVMAGCFCWMAITLKRAAVRLWRRRVLGRMLDRMAAEIR